MGAFKSWLSRSWMFTLGEVNRRRAVRTGSGVSGMRLSGRLAPQSGRSRCSRPGSRPRFCNEDTNPFDRDSAKVDADGPVSGETGSGPSGDRKRRKHPGKWPNATIGEAPRRRTPGPGSNQISKVTTRRRPRGNHSAHERSGWGHLPIRGRNGREQLRCVVDGETRRSHPRAFVSHFNLGKITLV